MSAPILDTTVLVHLQRKYQPALTWFNQQNIVFAITSITWMEAMIGVANKQMQERLLTFLDGFNLLNVTSEDQQWAMERIKQLQFSHHPRINDTLIAAVAHRLQVPLYTHNLKHMKPLIGSLAAQPYT